MSTVWIAFRSKSEVGDASRVNLALDLKEFWLERRTPITKPDLTAEVARLLLHAFQKRTHERKDDLVY